MPWLWLAVQALFTSMAAENTWNAQIQRLERATAFQSAEKQPTECPRRDLFPGIALTMFLTSVRFTNNWDIKMWRHFFLLRGWSGLVWTYNVECTQRIRWIHRGARTALWFIRQRVQFFVSPQSYHDYKQSSAMLQKTILHSFCCKPKLTLCGVSR